MFKKNKRGSIDDIVLITTVLFVFAILVVIGYKAYSGFDDGVQAMDEMPQKSKDVSTQVASIFPGALDNMFLILAIGLAVAALAMATFVRIHPVFIVFFLIILTFIIFLSGVFSHTYHEIISSSDMTLPQDLNTINNVMQFLSYFIAVFGSLLAIIMYKGWQAQP